MGALLPSTGTAVVTQNKAALWTDSRYWVQAEREMDCNWDLEKDSECDRSWICLFVSFIMAKVCYDTRALLAREHRIYADNCCTLSQGLSGKDSSLEKLKALQVCSNIDLHSLVSCYAAHYA